MSRRRATVRVSRWGAAVGAGEPVPETKALLLTKDNVEAELVNLTTAAQMLGCSRQAVGQYVERGDLEVVFIGSTRAVWVRQVKELAPRLRIPGRKPVRPELVAERITRIDDARQASRRTAQDRLQLSRLKNDELRTAADEYAVRIKNAANWEEKERLRRERNQKFRKIRREFSRRLRAS